MTQKTRHRKQQRGRQRQRQRRLTILLLIAAGIILLVALFVFGKQPATGEIPADAWDRYEGIPQGRSEEGFPILGSEAAVVSLRLFTSFDCARCAAQRDLLNQLLPRLASDEAVSLQFIPIVSNRMLELPNAKFATRFALCAGRYGRFWEYQEALYSWQEFEQRAYSSARLWDGIDNLGLDRSEVRTCVRGSQVDTTIRAAEAAAETQLGFSQYGFPLFVVNLEPITPTTPGELPSIEQIQNALAAALAPPEEESQEEEVTESDATEVGSVPETPEASPVASTETPTETVPDADPTSTPSPSEETADEESSG